MPIRLKRAYEPADETDGRRILVDRLWPRGLTKEKAKIDLWLKEIAPSTQLRKWFGHDPARWEQFRSRYKAELTQNHAVLAKLKDAARRGNVTLIYSARDEEHNQAVVLKQFLENS